MNLQTNVKLNNGVEMPIIALGVWQMKKLNENSDSMFQRHTNFE